MDQTKDTISNSVLWGGDGGEPEVRATRTTRVFLSVSLQGPGTVEKGLCLSTATGLNPKDHNSPHTLLPPQYLACTIEHAQEILHMLSIPLWEARASPQLSVSPLAQNLPKETLLEAQDHEQDHDV